MVMFMAPGFAMLEAGMVRSKNTSGILVKNVGLFSIACIMYIVIGYDVMYAGGMLLTPDNGVEDVLASGGDVYYSGKSDFFFQVVFVATAMSIISGAVAERMKVWSFLLFAVVMTGFIYPFKAVGAGEAVSSPTQALSTSRDLASFTCAVLLRRWLE